MHFLTGNKGEGCKPNSEIEWMHPFTSLRLKAPVSVAQNH